ncbi:MAG: hypothetical protein ACE5GJ_03340 [Gemmatimonadota bacterium]
MRKLVNTLALAAAFAVMAAAPQEDPAALVVRVQGEVQVIREGAPAAPATVGARLVPGDRVVPENGSRAILITRTGATQVVTGPTTVTAPSGGGNPDMFARAVRTLAQAATTDARTAGGRQGMIRPIPGEPTLVAPRNGLTVTTTRPTFSWMPVEGAHDYRIQIRRVDGGKPMRFKVTGTHEWTLPDSVPELEMGAVYAWTVAPARGRPTREQQFQVIDGMTAADLNATIQEISDLGLDPHGDGLFLTAVIYRDMGLFYEADHALEEMEKTGELSADLYLLKGEILNRLGYAERAREAFDKADAMMR